MNDERFLKDWLKDASERDSDPQAAADKVMASVPETRQRSRWLPWLPARRRAPTDDSPPNISGRTRSMFSPSTAVVAGVLTLAIGGTLFLTQQNSEQGGLVPGAEDEAIVAPVKVSGTSESPAGCSETDYEGAYEEAGVDAFQWECTTGMGMPWSFTDPRLEGTVSRLNEESRIQLDDGGDVYIAAVRYRIENDGGTWTERPRTWIMPDGYRTVDWLRDETVVLDGDGEYEGLVTVLRYKTLNTFEGFILDERMFPPPPEESVSEL